MTGINNDKEVSIKVRRKVIILMTRVNNDKEVSI